MSAVNHPPHYTYGKNEVIDIIEDWFPDNPHLFSAVQYVARAEHKGNYVQDLEKAIWYLQRAIQKEKEAQARDPELEELDRIEEAKAALRRQLMKDEDDDFEMEWKARERSGGRI